MRRYSVNERKVDVYLDDCLVGTLAETADRTEADLME